MPPSPLRHDFDVSGLESYPEEAMLWVASLSTGFDRAPLINRAFYSDCSDESVTDLRLSDAIFVCVR